MQNRSDFEAWCWQRKKHSFSNKELFSLARQLAGKKEISGKELASRLQKTVSRAERTPARQAPRTDEAQALQQLANALRSASRGAQPDNSPAAGKAPDSSSGPPSNARPSAAELLRTIAQALLRETGSVLPEQRHRALQQHVPAIQAIDGLKFFVQTLRQAVQGADQHSHKPLSEAQTPEREPPEALPGGSRAGRGIGSPVLQADTESARPADRFNRLQGAADDNTLFHGVKTADTDDAQMSVPPAAVLFETVSAILERHVLPQTGITPHDAGELSREELTRMLEELLQLNILSPAFSENFLINQDKTAYLLAKQAYLRTEGLFAKKHPLQKGTHMSGRRGLQEVQPDKVRRSRRLSSSIAVYQTLRRSLQRRALSPYASLLEDEDIMEFSSRKKVGYAVALALDVSGAVQFGRRIQAVRRACMAFHYYSRRFHPHDRVHCVAYHETAREITFPEVSRLRAVNGAGKDIGGCLQKCLDILRRDPDRVPVVILIGDGLPAAGDRAGFYRFMENNREYIERAYAQARLLRKQGVLFTFLQFREDRHLWQEYADAAAQQIARSAGGILCRIAEPDTMAVALVASFEQLKSGAVLFAQDGHVIARETAR